MPIEFRCTGCQKLLRVADSSVGKKARCPDCGAIQNIPVSGAPDAAPAADAAPRTDSPFGGEATAGNRVENPFADHPSPPPGALPGDPNPYAASTSPAQQHAAINQQAMRARVEGPATTLMVWAGLVCALALVGLVFQIVMVGIGEARGPDSVWGVIGTILTLMIYGAVYHGASQMRQLQGYGRAMTAAILAMLPCSICCVIGLPLGIWALLVLNDPAVRSAFRP